MNIDLYSASKKRFLSKKLQKGATMIEYALLASLIAIASITFLTSAGTEISNEFGCVAKKLGASNSATCPS